MARTIPNIGNLLQALEELLRTKYIYAVIYSISSSCSLRRPGSTKPSHLSTTEYSASMKVTQPPVDHIIKQDEQYGYEILQVAKAEVHKSK